MGKGTGGVRVGEARRGRDVRGGRRGVRAYEGAGAEGEGMKKEGRR